LLIGGATTSDKHTAVKIAPEYENGVVHVLDASRSVGVVEKLIGDQTRENYLSDYAKVQSKLVAGYEERQMTLIPYAEKKFATDWGSVDVPTPSFTGTQTIGCGYGGEGLPTVGTEISLQEIAEYIDWSPFFASWELHGKYPKILDDDVVGEEAKKLFTDAQQMLNKLIDEKLLCARGMFGFWPANSEGDSIILYCDDSRQTELTRFHMLRQQWQRKGIDQFRSLADYIAPVDSGRADYIGGFTVTTGHGCDEICQRYRDEHDDYNAIMVAALADRLAEAFAEMLHYRARCAWGFGNHENLDNEALIKEGYRGIRPAAGYPACPDHTEKGTLWRLMDVEAQTGIRLTESYAMWPGAAVSGLYFAHPEARYFAVNKVTKDQVEDYAKRKGEAVDVVERWLQPVLGYKVS
jgi:5-methyltetrahydrofolate--homocysteine methyltransferase